MSRPFAIAPQIGVHQLAALFRKPESRSAKQLSNTAAKVSPDSTRSAEAETQVESGSSPPFSRLIQQIADESAPGGQTPVLALLAKQEMSFSTPTLMLPEDASEQTEATTEAAGQLPPKALLHSAEDARIPGKRPLPIRLARRTDSSAAAPATAETNTPDPIRLKLPSLPGAADRAVDPPRSESEIPTEKPELPLRIHPPAALELKIHLSDDSAARSSDPAVKTPIPVKALAIPESIPAVPVSAAPQLPVEHMPAGSSPGETPLAAASPPAAPIHTRYVSPPAEKLSTPPPSQLDEPSQVDSKWRQPLRSLAIEFTPDGAGDVRMRMSERAGDVHISLHSTDSGLTGRLSEGLHELVGSLANAGYDAQAWTPDRGHDEHRHGEEPRNRQRNQRKQGAAEDFSGMIQQPVQELL